MKILNVYKLQKNRTSLNKSIRNLTENPETCKITTDTNDFNRYFRFWFQ